MTASQHGARLLGVGGLTLSGLASIFILIALLEIIQAIASPQPDAKQNRDEENQEFQRLRPKTTSSTKREPA